MYRKYKLIVSVLCGIYALKTYVDNCFTVCFFMFGDLLRE